MSILTRIKDRFMGGKQTPASPTPAPAPAPAPAAAAAPTPAGQQTSTGISSSESTSTWELPQMPNTDSMSKDEMAAALKKYVADVALCSARWKGKL